MKSRIESLFQFPYCNRLRRLATNQRFCASDINLGGDEKGNIEIFARNFSLLSGNVISWT